MPQMRSNIHEETRKKEKGIVPEMNFILPMPCTVWVSHISLDSNKLSNGSNVT